MGHNLICFVSDQRQTMPRLCYRPTLRFVRSFNRYRWLSYTAVQAK